MIIRMMQPADRSEILAMMREFYDSPALLQQVSDEILVRNVDACLSESPYVEGYVFAEGQTILGYGIPAKSFSTEAGGICIWIEDLYLKEEYRHLGIGSAFFDFVRSTYTSAARLRLEVEADNTRAIAAYRKNGYNVLPYMQMVIDDNVLK